MNNSNVEYWTFFTLTDNILHRSMPSIVADNMENSMITWLLTSICKSSIIKNPYLVAKIVEVVYVLNPSMHPRCENLYSRLMHHPLSQDQLASALMKFYTDVETTGSSSEFYDKFSIRYHISLIIKGEYSGIFHCVSSRSIYLNDITHIIS